MDNEINPEDLDSLVDRVNDRKIQTHSFYYKMMWNRPSMWMKPKNVESRFYLGFAEAIRGIGSDTDAAANQALHHIRLLGNLHNNLVGKRQTNALDGMHELQDTINNDEFNESGFTDSVIEETDYVVEQTLEDYLTLYQLVDSPGKFTCLGDFCWNIGKTDSDEFRTFANQQMIGLEEKNPLRPNPQPETSADGMFR